MIVVGMDGQVLPDKNGFPARMLVPGLFGFVSATKWLERIEFTTYAQRTAYWTERDWATDAPILTQSRIDVPKSLTTLPKDKPVLAGVAWAQHRGIEQVEIRIDGGVWQPAKLADDAGIDVWRQWTYVFDGPPGQHTAEVRATDRTGATQPEERTKVFPDGARGWHQIVFTVEVDAGSILVDHHCRPIRRAADSEPGLTIKRLIIMCTPYRGPTLTQYRIQEKSPMSITHQSIAPHRGLAAVVVLPISFAACGASTPRPPAPPRQLGTDAMASQHDEIPACRRACPALVDADQPFGSGCSAVPTTGKGSFDGMSSDPVATAASNNPVLSTLVTAVGKAGLGDTLNTTDDITVFAPTNDAFKNMDQATLKKALADKKLLT